MKDENKRRVAAAMTMVVFVAVSAIVSIGPATAQGTDPNCSTGCSPKYNDRYWPATTTSSDLMRAFGKIYRMTESDSTYDWYHVANTMRQIQSIACYEYPNFWNELGEEQIEGSGFPSKVDWAPGVLSVGTGSTTFTISTSGVGGSASTTWGNQWRGNWDIEDEWSRTGSVYRLDGHQEWFNANNFDWDIGWDRTSFGAAWKTQATPHHGVFLRSAILYNPDESIANCLNAAWFWADTDYHWIGIAKEAGDDNCFTACASTLLSPIETVPPVGFLQEGTLPP